MDYFLRYLVLCFGILILSINTNCSARLVPKEKIQSYNEIFLERTYVLKEDLKFSKEDSLSKGAVVKVFIESTPSLLKVKCYPIQESREYAIGRMAIYKINDQIEKRELSFEDLELVVAEKFDPYNPKKKRNR